MQVEAAPEDVFDPLVGVVAVVQGSHARGVGAILREALQVSDDGLHLPQLVQHVVGVEDHRDVVAGRLADRVGERFPVFAAAVPQGGALVWQVGFDRCALAAGNTVVRADVLVFVVDGHRVPCHAQLELLADQVPGRRVELATEHGVAVAMELGTLPGDQLHALARQC